METVLEIKKKTGSMHIETIDIGKHSGFDSKIIRFDLYIDQYRKYYRIKHCFLGNYLRINSGNSLRN